MNALKFLKLKYIVAPSNRYDKSSVLFLFLFLFSLNISSQNFSLAFANITGSLGYDQQTAIATDSCGNLYVTGSFSGTVDFDPSANVLALSTGTQQTNVYVAKYNATGGLIWIKQFRANQWSSGASINVDQNGNIGFTSGCSGIGDIDPGPGVVSVGVSSGVGQNVYVKLDAQGNLLFGFVIGAWIPSTARLIFDANGDLLLSGCFYGTVDLDAGPGTSTVSSVNGTRDFFICRYTAAGVFLWGKRLGANGADRINDINIDNAGNIIAIGNFANVLDFDPGPSTFNLNMSLGEMFILKLSALGNFIWAKQFGNGTTFQNLANDVETDAANNIYVVGHYSYTVDVDPTSAIYNLISLGLHDCFLMKISPAGTFISAAQFGGFGFDYFFCLDIASNGDLFIGGNFQQSVDFDPNVTNYFLNAISFHDGFVLHLDNSANFLNVYQFASNSSTTSVYPSQIVLQKSGALYVTGDFDGTADFDPSALLQNQTSAGSSDAFLLKLSPCLDAPSKNCDVVHACARASVTLATLGGNNLIWTDAISQSSVGAGQSFVTPIFPSGTYTYYVSASTCTLPNNNAVFVVSVSPSPSLVVTPTSVNVCIGSVINFSTAGASNYFWNNSATAQPSVVSFVAASNTVLTVQGTNTTTSCSSSKTVSINVANCIGIQEQSHLANVSVFPNPFFDDIVLESKDDGSAILMDCLGRELAHLNFLSGVSKFTFPDIKGGIYFLKISSNQSQSTVRLVKEER